MNKAYMAIMLAALLGGGFAGMAMMGVIDVPGLSPAKKKADAAALYEGDKSGEAGGKAADDKKAGGATGATADKADKGTAKGAKPAASADAPDKGTAKHSEASAAPKTGQTARATPPKPKPASDPELGYKKAAKLWNEMSVDALVAMTKEYKGPDLARIFALMDTSKVAKVLEKLATDTKRSKEAATLTKAIEKVASKPKPAT